MTGVIQLLTRRSLGCLLCSAAIGAGACSARVQNHEPAGTKAQQTDDPVPEVSRQVGPEGGTLILTRGQARGAKIVIPPGALVSPVMITMRADDGPIKMPPGVQNAGPVVVFGPEGQVFKRPVAVTLPTVRGANAVYTRPLSSTEWTRVSGGRYDPAGGMIADVTHFSAWVSATDPGPAPAPAPSDQTRQILKGYIENVTGALVAVHGARVNRGGGLPPQLMHNAKIIQNPRPSQDNSDRYLAVYDNALESATPSVYVAKSDSLLTWTLVRELAGPTAGAPGGASDPTITVAPEEYVYPKDNDYPDQASLSDAYTYPALSPGFLLAWREGVYLAGQTGMSYLKFVAYGNNDLQDPSKNPLYTTTSTGMFRQGSCDEGFPEIVPWWGFVSFKVYFYYRADCTHNRLAIGKLVHSRFIGFSFNYEKDDDVKNNAVFHWTLPDIPREEININSQSHFSWYNQKFTIISAQRNNDQSSSFCFIYDEQTQNAEPLSIKTFGKSSSFASPSVMVMHNLEGNGKIGQDILGLSVALYIPKTGAGYEEDGQLIYRVSTP